MRETAGDTFITLVVREWEFMNLGWRLDIKDTGFLRGFREMEVRAVNGGD